jgi:hypothetical protein
MFKSNSEKYSKNGVLTGFFALLARRENLHFLLRIARKVKRQNLLRLGIFG